MHEEEIKRLDALQNLQGELHKSLQAMAEHMRIVSQNQIVIQPERWTALFSAWENINNASQKLGAEITRCYEDAMKKA